MYKTDTICAIASAMTNAGIGIIRVSGSDAIEKVDRIYKGKQKLTEVESHTVQYGHIVYDDKVIDEVMVLVLKAPRTYTTEDTVEIDCHGGTLVMQEILKAVMAQGVRPAEPGEFTKRAFFLRLPLEPAPPVVALTHYRQLLQLVHYLIHGFLHGLWKVAIGFFALDRFQLSGQLLHLLLNLRSRTDALCHLLGELPDCAASLPHQLIPRL